MNYEVTIKPLRCSQVTDTTVDSDHCFDDDENSASDTVVIYNKRREKLKFEVPAKMTLQSVIIDSVDSVLHT